MSLNVTECLNFEVILSTNQINVNIFINTKWTADVVGFQMLRSSS